MIPTDSLASALPDIEIIQSNDEAYDAYSHTFNSAIEKKPLAIAIPKTAEEVALIVKHARSIGASVTVRCGGHDLFGRALADGAIAIDVRAINHVNVHEDAGQAVIGGGVQAVKLGQALAEHGYTTPCPTIGAVGYIGYATTGGYGQMAHKLGLGIDQLLGAKIVDAEGNLVQADEDVMKAIRGAASNFGIVVEATIKIYPFSQFLSGIIIFESSDYRTSMLNVQRGMEALAAADDHPPELDLQPMYGFVPPMGIVYGGFFMWAGPDLERGRKYLDKITSFHPVVMNQVGPADLVQTHKDNAAVVPSHAYSDTRTVNVRRITPEIYQAIIEGFAKMPNYPAGMLTWHEVKSCSPSFNRDTSLPSVFNARESHFLIEIIANAANKENFEALSKWGSMLQDEIIRNARGELLDSSWLASIRPGEAVSLEKLYGEDNARFLRALKKEKDPHGIFRHAQASLM